MNVAELRRVCLPGVALPGVTPAALGCGGRRDGGKREQYVVVTCSTNYINIRINTFSGEKYTSALTYRIEKYDVIPYIATKIYFPEDSDNNLTMFETFKNQTQLLEVDISHMNLRKCYNMNGCFSRCSNLRKITLQKQKLVLGRWSGIFDGNPTITSLDTRNLVVGINPYDPVQRVTCESPFGGCTSLSELKFAPGLEHSFDFRSCPLNEDSIVNILTGLARVATTQTIRFKEGTTIDYKVGEPLVAEATSKGWSIVNLQLKYPPYITITSKSDSVKLTINNVEQTHTVKPNIPTKIYIDEVITSLQWCVFYQSQVTSIDFSNLDVSSCYSYLSMAAGLGACTSIDARFNQDKPNRDLRNAFGGDTQLKDLDISTWNMSLNSTWMSYVDMFSNNKALTDLKFGYNLATSISFKSSPLSHESALSVINGLADIKKAETITFKQSTYDTLTEDEIALATSKGWTIISV